MMNVKRYMARLYHAKVATCLEAILADESCVDGDRLLAKRIIEMGVPCSESVVWEVRHEFGLPSRYQRLAGLKQAAHQMVANQPIEIG